MNQKEPNVKNEIITLDGQLDNFMPVSLKDKMLLADQLVRSGLIPAGFNTPAKAMVALQMGHELGLKPMVALNSIAVVNGRPTLGADLIVAIIRTHPEYAGMEIKGDDKQCTVTIRRKTGDIVDTFTNTFTMADATRAQLTSKDSWKKYPQRMLKHRAISYCAKDAFPDALAGIYTPEEMESVEPVRQELPDIKPDNKPDIKPEVHEPEVMPKGNYSKALDAIEKATTYKEVDGIEKMKGQRSWTPDEEKLLAIKLDEKKKMLQAKLTA